MTEKQLRKLPWYTASNSPGDRSGPWETSEEEEPVSYRVVSDFSPVETDDRHNGYLNGKGAKANEARIQTAVEALVFELAYCMIFYDKSEISQMIAAEARRIVLTDTLRLLFKLKGPLTEDALVSDLDRTTIGRIFKPLALIRMDIEKELAVVNRYIKPVKGCRMVRRKKHRFFTGRQ